MNFTDFSYDGHQFRREAMLLFEQGNYAELHVLLTKALKVHHATEVKDPLMVAELAGSLTDFGSETNQRDYVQAGLDMFLENREIFAGHITESSIEYCLGNAYSALYKLSAPVGFDWYITPEIVKEDLFEAKQCFFRSFKLINLNELDEFSIQVLTNLASNLIQSGRIVEALQLFDMVLYYNPAFPNALIGKADTLSFMVGRTYCQRSISLFAEIYFLFQNALSQNLIIPPDIQRNVDVNFEQCARMLKKLEFDFENAENEFELNRQEYETHSSEIKFYLDNFLGLSEHSLYCKCSKAGTDDINIGFPGMKFRDRKIAELEHLLNRIKSEFSFARRQLFEFLHTITADNVFYQNFGVHELIYGAQNEKLRISFRMCFGILDKIAHGILYLYDLEKANNENTYFESFWKNPKAPPGRWEKFNDVRSTHLTALYSIACDLSKHNGEFSYYKTWRNQLEHDVFSLVPANSKKQDVLDSKLLSTWTNQEDFQEKALHLLQIVRAAIFSFTFCCREELIVIEQD